jgi:hypothetical protein
MRLGDKQIELLAALGCPTWSMICGDKMLRRLAALGLLRPLGDDSFFCITPAGLRALADALDAGRIKQSLPKKRSDEDDAPIKGHPS